MEKDNILIARFMGAYPHDSRDLKGMWFNDKGFPHGFINIMGSGIKYSTNWNWLMEVVEKIDNLRTLSSTEETYLYCVELYGDGAKIMDGKTGGDGVIVEIISGGNWIETTYKLCVEFVKWYNENKS